MILKIDKKSDFMDFHAKKNKNSIVRCKNTNLISSPIKTKHLTVLTVAILVLKKSNTGTPLNTLCFTINHSKVILTQYLNESQTEAL